MEAFDEKLTRLFSLGEKAAADGVSFISGTPGPDECRNVNDIILNATKDMLSRLTSGDCRDQLPPIVTALHSPDQF
ncbi:hypothetical protein ElyMa_000861300 [Elysia marginata]|uniref:Uncharacterized protein n=1 Tax=Elysia marginata TaxID=1093978 RepID=A0AAV4H3S9_9GAST|nr:hypothetical protein ElyMa_000861300 [Elysia marginata]